MKLKTLSQAGDLEWKKILLRVDFNVPLSDWKITDDTRIKKALPTIEFLKKSWAKIIICSHLGRPKWERKKELSLSIVADRLWEILRDSSTGSEWQVEVKFIDELIWEKVVNKVNALTDWEILVLENTRFEKWETKNDCNLSDSLASLADVFVSDCFWVAHRAHSSIFWVSLLLPSFAWFLIEREIEALSWVMKNPEKPVLMVVAGSKMETKIAVIEKFIEIADKIIVWWAIANTLLKAKWVDVWDSLYEESEIENAKRILEKWWEKIVLPFDAIVSSEFSDDAEFREIHLAWDWEQISEIDPDEKILDIWSSSIEIYKNLIKNSKTIIWNWPVWVYEFKPFENWTKAILQSLKDSSWTTVLWWWDTVDAMNKFWFNESDFSHVSTWWWASLEFLEWKTLPWIEVLMK